MRGPPPPGVAMLTGLLAQVLSDISAIGRPYEPPFCSSRVTTNSSAQYLTRNLLRR
jgi:hypothetical protein